MPTWACTHATRCYTIGAMETMSRTPNNTVPVTPWTQVYVHPVPAEFFVEVPDLNPVKATLVLAPGGAYIAEIRNAARDSQRGVRIIDRYSYRVVPIDKPGHPFAVVVYGWPSGVATPAAEH